MRHVEPPACLVGCFTISDARPFVISSSPASRGPPQWRWSVIERRASTGGTRSSTPGLSETPQPESIGPQYKRRWSVESERPVGDETEFSDMTASEVSWKLVAVRLLVGAEILVDAAEASVKKIAGG